MKEKIFISYSRKDIEKAKSIREEIERRLGVKCWMDLSGIESSQHFDDVLASTINVLDVFLFMYSRNSIESEWAIKEINHAAANGKNIVIVSIYGDNLDQKSTFAFHYRTYTLVDYANISQREKLFEDLAHLCDVKSPMLDISSLNGGCNIDSRVNPGCGSNVKKEAFTVASDCAKVVSDTFMTLAEESEKNWAERINIGADGTAKIVKRLADGGKDVVSDMVVGIRNRKEKKSEKHEPHAIKAFLHKKTD